jgi:putative acetyltransferase
MNSSGPVELVVASFDDPIVTGLRREDVAGPDGSTGAGPLPGDAGVVYLVARQAHVPVGCAGLRRLGDDTAEVERLYVQPEHRGRGISRLLLAGVEDLARRRGFTVARLEAGDLRTAGLYASSGYVRIAPFGRHPARSVCFEKSLRTPIPVPGGWAEPGPR